MPSFFAGHATESVMLTTSNTSSYNPPHRKSQEKSSSLSSTPGALMNGYSIDNSTGGKRIIDGVFISDANGLNPSLQSLPNGRSSGSTDSRERGRSKNENLFSTANGGGGNLAEKERESLAPVNGSMNHPIVEQAILPMSGNGEVAVTAGPRKLEIGPPAAINHHFAHTRAHSSSAPQSPISPCNSLSLLDAHPTPMDINQAALPINRFSSPSNFSATTTIPVTSSTASLPAGPARLQHRHTLQVPRLSTGSSSRDFSLPATNMSNDAIGDAGRSPVSHGIGRFSTTLGRRPTQSIHSDHYGDEVPPDHDMARRSETTRHKRVSRRHRKEEEEDDRVVVGTKVDMNHVNWVTSYNMLTGIRFTVSRTNAKIDRDLTDDDFDTRNKFSFDITGNELTPSAKYDFKFKDYAPWVFRHLRARFNLDPADYLMSLTSKYILSELGSPGKSGSFFYFSRDYKYIIKTIHHAEHKLLRRILREYYAHIEKNPNTLISQFYGLHRVKIPYGRKIHFVVMNNLFPPHRDIHQTFDLKGSTIGRDFKEEDLEKNPRATLKDLNWLRRNYHFEFGHPKRDIFIEQMKRDVALLQKLKIMDYSLLVGIHDMSKGNEENLRDKTLQVFQPGGEHHEEPQPNALLRTPSKVENARKAKELRQIIKREKPVPMEKSTNMLPDEMLEERKNSIFYSDDGGFRATHENGEPGEEIYYLGIIDCLTHYGFIKRAEHLWKSLGSDKTQISPIPPEGYGERFVKFITGLTMTKEEAERETRSGDQRDGSVLTNMQFARASTDKVINKAEQKVLRIEKEGASEDSTPDRTLSALRAGSVDRTSGAPGATLPVVEEDGEATSKESSVHNEKNTDGAQGSARAPRAFGDQPLLTLPKDSTPRDKKIPSTPYTSRFSMTESSQPDQRLHG